MDDVEFTWNGDIIEGLYMQAADETLLEAATEIVERAKRKAPRAFGNLAASIGMSRPFSQGAHRAVSVGFMGGKKNAVRYAMAVERGRDPGKMPPPKELEPWVEMKLGAGRDWKGKTTGVSYARKGSRKIKDLTDRNRQIKSLAFVVARSIGREGTKEQPFLIPAYDEVIAGGQGLSQRYMRRIKALESKFPKMK